MTTGITIQAVITPSRCLDLDGTYIKSREIAHMLWNTPSASNPALEAPLLPNPGLTLSTPSPYASSLNLPAYAGTASSSPHTIAFIDATITDAALVMAGVQADLKVFLNPNQDGIAQITETLGYYQGLTGIEIISHGNAGALQLGGSFLSSLSLEQYAPQLQQWGNSLAAGADILFYGCDLAQNDGGKSLVNQISQLTGADVAASIDLTGNAKLGGNWTLEYTTGSIETASPFSAALMSTYQGLFANSSIFTPSATPNATNLTDGVTYELGMKFTSTKAGQIESIRYWKSPSETGAHVGKIWSSSGQLLGSVTFTNETASGWQQQSLTTPITIAAGTTYTVSVNTNGYYATTNSGLSSAITSGDITALVGGGVYGNINTLPGQSFQNSNYFRDVVFAPTAGNTPGTATISGITSQGNTLTANVADPDGLSGVTITYQWQQSSDGSTWTSIGGATNPALVLDNTLVGKQVRVNTIYTDVLGGSENLFSPASNAIGSLSAGTSIFTPSATPSAINLNDGVTYELGMRFTSSKAGQIESIRYWKAPNESGTHVGKIWSSTGQLLGSVTFTNETASGWQQQALSAPVTIAAGTTYTVSVNTNGFYATTNSGLSSAITSGDITALAGGGVYGNAGSLPGQSFQNSNYFRDVVFVSTVVNPNNTPGTLSISGTATQNQTLTATVTDTNGLSGVSIAYQWQQSSNGTTWSSIAGATGQTFTLTQAQVNQQVRVTATYTDALGSNEVPISSASAAVGNVNDLGTVTLSGITSQGNTLTANVADPDGLSGVTITYQWQQSSDGSTWTSIGGATNPALVLDNTLVGKQVRVNTIYTDVLGGSENLFSPASNAIGSLSAGTSIFTPSATPSAINLNDGVTYELGMRFTSSKAGQIESIRYWKAPNESGTHVGKIWSSTGQLLGSVTFTNETASGWQQQSLTTPITIAAGTTYTVSVNTNGFYATTNSGLSSAITSGDITALVGGGVYGNINTLPGQSYQNSNYFRDVVFVSTVVNPNNTPGTLSISGTATQNQTLTATVGDTDGLAGVSIAYQWQQSSNGTTWSSIAGATGQTFTLTQAQVNQQVRVTATYTDALGSNEAPISSASVAVGNVNDLGTVTLSGITTSGNTLTATVADADGLSGVNFTYQWQQSSDGTTWSNIIGATSQTFNLNSSLANKQVRTRVTYTDALGTSETIFSSATSSIATSSQTQTLFTTQTPVSTNLTDGSGSAGDYELGMEFRSIEAGTIDAIRYYKASSETGTHIGKIWSSTGQLLASVIFTNETSSGWQQQALSTPIAIAANTTYVVSVNANSYYVSTANGIITTLTNGDISAVADGSNGVYNTTPGNFPIQSYQNSNYFRDIVFTPNPINPTNNPGTVSVSGTTTQNQILTATVADQDGLTGNTIAYQWQQSSNGIIWSNIAGATSQTLTLGQAQVNQQVRVSASYIDVLGTNENVLSSATTAVVNVNDLGTIILKGSATNGSTLEETVLDADGLSGSTISYQWQQLTNTLWTNITGATSKTLSLNTALIGQQVRVLASYIDALGSSENVASSGVTVAAQNAIVLENQKAGTTAWQLSNTATNKEIGGYGDATSINKGEAINLKISLDQAGQYNLDVYRLGYYGGAGGHLVTSVTGLNGVVQAGPTFNPTTRLVEYNWNTSYTLQTDANWTTGLYFVKLTNGAGKESYIQFVLRDDNRPADIGFQDAIATAQAYNSYGGYSTYNFNSTGLQRAYQVSFDRPFQYDSSASSEQFNNTLTWEYNMTRWLESQGYDVSYYTNIDASINPLQLYSQKTFLSVGHDEYWSMDQRNNVEQARDNGTNLAFFSANTAYWQVRYEASSTGQANRVMTVYKNATGVNAGSALDPIAQTNPAAATTLFRSAEVNRPENSLLGIGYIGDWSGRNLYNGADYVISNAADPYFANTGLQNGDRLIGLIGYEWDGLLNNGLTPAGLVVLSSSPVQPLGSLPLLPPGTDTTLSNSVRYTAPSGAKVFSTGSVQWMWGLDSSGVPNPRTDVRAQQIAVNVFADMGATPQTPDAGIVVPS